MTIKVKRTAAVGEAERRKTISGIHRIDTHHGLITTFIDCGNKHSECTVFAAAYSDVLDTRNEPEQIHKIQIFLISIWIVIWTTI